MSDPPSPWDGTAAGATPAPVAFDPHALREPGEARWLRRTALALVLVYAVCIGLTLSIFFFWMLLALATVAVLRSRYRSESIEVGPAQLPRVHALLARCAARLSLPAPKLFVSAEPGSWPVYTVPLPGPAIVMSGRWLEMLDDDELSFFLYHELAHARLGHRFLLDPINVLENVGPLSWILATPLEIARWFLRPWSRLAEFSADRVALACLDGDLDLAARALAKVTAGDELCRQVDGGAFLAQARDLTWSPTLFVHELATGRLGNARRLARLAAFSDSGALPRPALVHTLPARGESGPQIRILETRGV